MSEQENPHKYCTNKFIELANQLKDEQIDPNIVSAALMTASAVYATFVSAGNQGTLEVSGVDKVATLFREILEHHQAVMKEYLQEQQPGQDG